VKKKITTNWTINKLLAEYPESAEVLVDFGFHCIGCALAQYETIEQGAKAHGLSTKQIKKLLEELNSLGGKRTKKKQISKS
jgi:hybrid cluster-associated redox disulfide protein